MLRDAMSMPHTRTACGMCTARCHELFYNVLCVCSANANNFSLSLVAPTRVFCWENELR